jgi:hypothetical protein
MDPFVLVLVLDSKRVTNPRRMFVAMLKKRANTRLSPFQTFEHEDEPEHEHEREVAKEVQGEIHTT